MRKILTLLFIPIIMGCNTQPDEPLVIIDSPAGPNSSLPRLFTNDEGETYLSWVEKSADKTTRLRYTSMDGKAWTEAQDIASGKNWFVNWADFPSLIVSGEQMTAHWLQKSDLGTYDYDVRVSFSQDRGKQWSEPMVAHNDGMAAEHGFVSMLPLENGETFITWLDGRNTKNETEPKAMTLRAGIFGADGSRLKEWELDNRVCDCCQTSAAMTEQGLVVVYRDRSENEIRDMSIVRLIGDEWTQPMPIAIELWEIAGCPVNGPSVSAQGNNLAAAWFTAKGGFAQVKLGFSSNAGADFGQPIVVSEGATNGRVGLDHLPNGDVVVSWMDTKDEQALIMAARYDSQGVLINKMQVAETSAARASGFPVVTCHGEEIVMAWTETGEQSQVKTARIKL